MDDILTEAETTSQALKVCAEATELNATASTKLLKWASNDTAVLEKLRLKQFCTEGHDWPAQHLSRSDNQDSGEDIMENDVSLSQFMVTTCHECRRIHTNAS